MNVPDDIWLTVGTLRKLGEYVPPGIASKLLDISTKWEQFCGMVQDEEEGVVAWRDELAKMQDWDRASDDGMAGAD